MLPARKTPCNPGDFFGKSYPRSLGKLDEDSRLIKGSNAEMPNKPFLREFSSAAQAQLNLALLGCIASTHRLTADKDLNSHDRSWKGMHLQGDARLANL